ncbi:MAG: DUF4372 domain-containing protein [Bacillota bacterium]
MRDKDTKLSTFNQLFKPIFQKSFQEILKRLGVDKYVKKLFVHKLVTLMAFAQLEQLSSLREISNSLNTEGLRKSIMLDDISFSQISRRLADLPTEALQLLFKGLSLEIAKEIGVNALNKELGRICLIDSSTISLCLSQYNWAIFRSTKSGIKVHLRLRFFESGVLPEHVVITPAKPADKTQMELWLSVKKVH